MIFAATGSASFDFYGADRIGDNLFADCVLALDARTGKRIWHFQGIKHDVWDYDFPAAPNLVTVTRAGSKIDAIAQITKTGYVYVFNRRTGEPLFPVEYRKTPASRLDGERLSETQPYPVKPPPYTRQTLRRRWSRIGHRRRTRGSREVPYARFQRNLHPAEPAWNDRFFLDSTAAGNGAARRLIRRRRCFTSTPTNSVDDPHGDARNQIAVQEQLRELPSRGSGRYATHVSSLVDIGKRRTRADLAAVIREGSGRMRASPIWTAASTISSSFW